MRLLKIDLATGKEEVIAEDKEYDVGGAMIDERKTNMPLAVSFTKARTEWKVLDDSVKADFDVLAKVRRGDFTVISQTHRRPDVARRLQHATTARSRTTSTTARRRRPTFLFINNRSWRR